MTVPTDDLNAVIAHWRRHPDPRQIGEAVTRGPQRQAFAVALYPYLDELDLPADLVDLVVEQCIEDPGLEEIIDLLVDCAFEPETPSAPSPVDRVLGALAARPDRDGLVVVLADLLVHSLGDCTDIPPPVTARFADLAVQLADRIDLPAYAPVYLARHRLHDPPDSSSDLHRCRRLAGGLPPGRRMDLLTDVAVEAGLIEDYPLARSAALEALALGALVGEDPDQQDPDQLDLDQLDLDQLGTLHLVVAATLDVSDRVAAIDYLSQVLRDDPRFAGLPDVTSEWFRLVVGHATDLMQARPTADEIRPFVEQLEQHEQWWSQHELQWAALIVIARFNVVTNNPGAAASWLDRAPADGLGDVDLDGEIAILRLMSAMLDGRLTEVIRLLRRSASLIQRSSLGEHRLHWVQVAQAVALVTRDRDARADLERLMQSVIGTMTDEDWQAMGQDPSGFPPLMALHSELLELFLRMWPGKPLLPTW